MMALKNPQALCFIIIAMDTLALWRVNWTETEAGYSYWWDSERVAAVLVALSIEDYTNPLKPFSTDRNNKYGCKARTEAVEGKADYDAEYRPDGGVPVFQPCLRLHSDIEFVWRVYLDTNGEFTVKCFKAIHGANWESVAVGSEVDLTKNENEEFENDDEGEDEDEREGDDRIA